MEVLNVLELTIQEVRWVHARGFTSVYSIVDGSYLSPDSVAEWVATDAMIDPTFETMLIKFVLIGRYFFHWLLPTQHYLDWDITTELFPYDFNEGEWFIQQFFNRLIVSNNTVCSVRNRWGTRRNYPIFPGY